MHDNKGIGIHFSRNTTNSIAKNNKLNNQETPIELSSSNNNEVYNNEISKTTATPGITLKDGASGNKIHDNTFANIRIGILIHKTSINNSIYSNKISNINQQPMEIIKSKE